MDVTRVKYVVEAALLAAGRPLSIDTLASLFASRASELDRETLKSAIDALAEDYRDRGVEIKEVASGYRIQIRSSMSDWLIPLWEERAPRYTRALLETLSLIAYRQPITRAEIEEVRGVAVSSNIVRTLMERNWIRVVGHRDVPGKPAMFGTTRDFLDYFGLKRLEDLPALADIKDAMPELHPQADFLEVIQGGRSGGAETSPGDQEDAAPWMTPDEEGISKPAPVDEPGADVAAEISESSEELGEKIVGAGAVGAASMAGDGELLAEDNAGDIGAHDVYDDVPNDDGIDDDDSRHHAAADDAVDVDGNADGDDDENDDVVDDDDDDDIDDGEINDDDDDDDDDDIDDDDDDDDDDDIDEDDDDDDIDEDDDDIDDDGLDDDHVDDIEDDNDSDDDGDLNDDDPHRTSGVAATAATQDAQRSAENVGEPEADLTAESGADEDAEGISANEPLNKVEAG